MVTISESLKEGAKLPYEIREFSFVRDDRADEAIDILDMYQVFLGFFANITIRPADYPAVVAGLSLGCVSSPNSQSIPPDKNIEIATNQNAASTEPLKCAAMPRPNAPTP
jgi:hypothetical protein